MKKIITSFFIVAMFTFVAPVPALAHGGAESTQVGIVTQTSAGSTDTATQQEIKDLWGKMVTNTITKTEAQKLVTLMQTQGGGFGDMMDANSPYQKGDHGFWGMGMDSFGHGGDMDAWSGMGIGPVAVIFGVIMHILLLTLLILLVVWLWKKVVVKNK